MISNNVFTTTECCLTTRTTPQTQHFPNMLGNKEEAKDNAISETAHNQICTSLFKRFQEMPVLSAKKIEILNCPNPNELLNKRSELLSKCHENVPSEKYNDVSTVM